VSVFASSFFPAVRLGTTSSRKFPPGIPSGGKAILEKPSSSREIAVNVMEELEIKNESRWSNEDLSYKVVKWLNSLASLYPKLKEG
jgi:hypothetical protein